jgi:hypothetical protein
MTGGTDEKRTLRGSGGMLGHENRTEPIERRPLV